MGTLLGRIPEVVAAVFAAAGIVLLFVGAYFDVGSTNPLTQSVVLIVAGIVLFTSGMVFLLRRDTPFSDRLVGFLKDLFFST